MNHKKPIFFLKGEFLFPGREIEVLFSDELKKIFLEIQRTKEEDFFVFPIKNQTKVNSFYKFKKKNDDVKPVAVRSRLKLKFLLERDFDPSVLDSLKKVKLEGIDRVILSEIEMQDSFFVANCSPFEDIEINEEESEKLSEDFLSNLDVILEGVSSIDRIDSENFSVTMVKGNFSNLIFFVVQNSENINWDVKSKILNSNNVIFRFNCLLSASINKKVEKKLNKSTQEALEKEQEENYLRKKLEVIEEKLGKYRDRDLRKYLEQIKKDPYPEHVKNMVEDELENYTFSNPSEAGVIKQHISWLINLPWWQRSENINLNGLEYLEFARRSFDTHYGLKKVKDRIIEYLVAKERGGKESLGQIICLLGPSGVGKTSIASSIAKATGRKFIRISLAGVNDVGEIKGHRKTYIGAEPGIIIKRMKDAGCINPLFLINEIDKVSYDYRGASVFNSLLEVLDPEQNKYFFDNYLEVPYDLSEVMFVCTANSLEQFPVAVLDRMEIIEVSSYTRHEKLIIAKNYLLPSIEKEFNVKVEEVNFTDDAILDLIDFYTREAGVRSLKRVLKNIFRKFFVKQKSGEKDTDKLIIDTNNIENYLEKKVYNFTQKQKESKVGVCTGLAYTEQGGDILMIEVAKYSKKEGGFDLTGNLGEIMKESARIALSYIRANCEKFGINPEVFSNSSIHIHVPEGAIPKEGPSAGIALTSAVISCLTGKAINTNIGMTGEITLLGFVEPIGGLREKSIAAERSKLSTIIIPKQNEKDIIDIPEEVRNNLKIYTVRTYEEVWDIVFGGDKK